MGVHRWERGEDSPEWRRVHATFSTPGRDTAVADEYLELDDERVLVLLRDLSGRGKASGVDLGAVRGTKANLFELRDGKVTRYVMWFDRQRALADLGLASDSKHQ
jgi:hypothetical protein